MIVGLHRHHWSNGAHDNLSLLFISIILINFVKLTFGVAMLDPYRVLHEIKNAIALDHSGNHNERSQRIIESLPRFWDSDHDLK